MRNNCVLLCIREEGGEAGGRNVGKLWITQANTEWARGNVPRRNAKTLSMEAFVEYLNSL